MAKAVEFRFYARIQELLAGVAQGKRGMGELQQEAKQFAQSADEVRAKMALLTKELGGLKDVTAIRQKQEELKRLGAELDEINGKQAKAGPVSGGGEVQRGAFFGSFAGNIAAKGFELVSSAIGSVTEAMIGGNAEMETYTTQFATLLGSTDAAKTRLAELAKFGAETPFELPEIARAEKVLLGFGLTGQKVIDMTGKNAEEFRAIVGDIAAGTGTMFEEIALNMGKLASGATGEAISRFQELGIATREQLAAMGVQFSKSGELLSPLPVAMQAITKLTEEKFGGGMKNLSSTFSGLASTFQDVLGQIGRDIGAPMFAKAKEGLLKVLDVLGDPSTQKAVASVAGAIGDMIGFLADNADLLAIGASALVAYKTATSGAGKAVDIFSGVLMKSPMAVYAAAVVAAVAAVKALADAVQETAQEKYDAIEVDKALLQEQKSLVQEDKVAAEATRDLANRYVELAEKQNRTAQEQKELGKISDDLDKQYPGLIGHTKDFGDSLDGVRKIADDAKTSIGKYTDELGRLDKDMLAADLSLANQQVYVGIAKLNEAIAASERNILNKASSAVFGTDTVLGNVQEWTSSFGTAISKAGDSAAIRKAYGDFTRKVRDAIDDEGLSAEASKAAIEGAQKVRDLRLKYLAEREASFAPPPTETDKPKPEPPKPVDWDQIFKNRQLEIDLIDERATKLMEQFVLDQDIARNKIKNSRELTLTLEGIQKKFDEDAESLEKKRADAAGQAQIDAIQDESEKLLAQYMFDRAIAERDIKDTEERGYKLLELENEFNKAAAKLNTDASDRIRQLKIDAIDDEKKRLIENYKFKLDLIGRELISEEEKALKKKALEKETGRDLLKISKDARSKENEAYEKSKQAFLDDYATPVAQASTDLILSLTDDKMTAMEREQMFWNSMKNIALDVTGQILEKVIADGLMMLAESAGLVAAQAPIAAAAGATWAGPAALASTATFGGAAVAGAAGLSSTFALAQLMAVPKFLEKGGILNKPTFVAGEAGAEVVGSLTDLIAVFRAAIYGPQQRRTKILNRTQPRVNIGIGNKMFGRGSRSAQISQTSGAF